jgi:hypothetical protein
LPVENGGDGHFAPAQRLGDLGKREPAGGLGGEEGLGMRRKATDDGVLGKNKGSAGSSLCLSLSLSLCATYIERRELGLVRHAGGGR